MKELTSNGYADIIAQAIEEMKAEQGGKFSIGKINLAELERRTGISRAKLRRFQKNGFKATEHRSKGVKRGSLLDGYTAVIDDCIRRGITNSAVIYDRLIDLGYTGKTTIIKDYIASHKFLLPATRQAVAPQGNRGRRYLTDPGETYQMDWGFTNAVDVDGNEFSVACFAMICHHCVERYVEFFTNAKQENLFIGMIHAFRYMGVPKKVLTDNMKSVVIGRDTDGKPIWNKEYESFMNLVGFQTRLCKPYHPFTKGKVERLVRFVKDNFLADRAFYDLTNLNENALEWCNRQNGIFHAAVNCVPVQEHFNACAANVVPFEESERSLFYLSPERRISFDGFVNYEGRRFGVPYYYTERAARVMRDGDTIFIYSTDLSKLLVTHPVTWSKADRFCKDQYVSDQPEEHPTAPVHTEIRALGSPDLDESFEKFNFDREVIQ